MPELDPVLDAWLIGAPPTGAPTPSASAAEGAAETHLLSSNDQGSGGAGIVVDALTIDIAQHAVEQIRIAVGGEGAMALLYTNDLGDKRLSLTAELQEVHKRWKRKFDHLDSTMSTQAENLAGISRRWTGAEQHNADQYTV